MADRKVVPLAETKKIPNFCFEEKMIIWMLNLLIPMGTWDKELRGE